MRLTYVTCGPLLWVSWQHSPLPAQQPPVLSDDIVKIGVLDDLSGPYSPTSGQR